MEELDDILGGLEQRITIYKSKLIELQKKRDRLDDEIKTARKYLELAETLSKVEKNKEQPSSLPGTAENSGKDVLRGQEEARDFLLSTFRFAGLSIPEAAFILLKEDGTSLHAKDIYQRLIEGGVKIRSKTPITSVSISLNRDKRFHRIAPNTYRLAD